MKLLFCSCYHYPLMNKNSATSKSKHLLKQGHLNPLSKLKKPKRIEFKVTHQFGSGVHRMEKRDG